MFCDHHADAYGSRLLRLTDWVLSGLERNRSVQNIDNLSGYNKGNYPVQNYMIEMIWIFFGKTSVGLHLFATQHIGEVNVGLQKAVTQPKVCFIDLLKTLNDDLSQHSIF